MTTKVTDTVELSLYRKIRIESKANPTQWSEILVVDVDPHKVKVQLRHYNKGIDRPYYKNIPVRGTEEIKLTRLNATVKVGISDNDQPTLTATITYPSEAKWYRTN